MTLDESGALIILMIAFCFFLALFITTPWIWPIIIFIILPIWAQMEQNKEKRIKQNVI